MWLASSSFSSVFEFVKGANYRYWLQEREWGLDVYFSGPWAWAPTFLTASIATIFFLALFHLIPGRKRSIPLMIACGFLALLIGGAGTYLKSSEFLEAEGGGANPRIFTMGQGRKPSLPEHEAALLSVPAYVGGGAFLGSFLCSGFLLVFGGKQRSESHDAEEEEE